MKLTKPCNLRVMHIASGDLWAGAEVQLYTLTTTLQRKLSATIIVVLFNHGKLEQALREAGIQVIVFDEANLNGFRIFWQLAKTIRVWKPDVIHTHRNKENILGSIAARLIGHIPSMRTQHGASEHYPAWYLVHKQVIRLLDWLSGRFLQARIIAVSEDLASLLKRAFPADKIQVIENGVDLESLVQHSACPHITKNEQGKAWRVGVAGRLVPVKRVDLFIKAAHHLLKQYPELNISFHIFGDGPLREELKGLCHSLAVDSAVVFEGHCSNMAEMLSTLDVLVMTSDHEGLPMILLEAMALKVPIIAHRTGGIPHLLDQGKAGILVDEHNPEGYGQAIHQLLQNSDDNSPRVRSAVDRVNSIYNSETNASAYCNQYLEITSSILTT